MGNFCKYRFRHRLSTGTVLTVSIWHRYRKNPQTMPNPSCSMIMHGPMLQGSVHNSWKLKHPSSCMANILTGHVTHWAYLGCSGSVYTTAYSSSCQYPETSHSHWRGVDQHSTGHNQQPDQLYAKEMCCTAWGKWWSQQILTLDTP